MFLYSFYIPTIQESEGSYVYYGDEDPNDVIHWTRNPNVGDEYIQNNDNLTNEIRWQLTDSEWVIISPIRFFIQTPDGTTIYPDDTLTFRAAYEINGNIFLIDNDHYSAIKIDSTDYTSTVHYEDLSNTKKVLQLINTHNNIILDVVEVTAQTSLLDLTPPDNTNIDWLANLWS